MENMRFNTEEEIIQFFEEKGLLVVKALPEIEKDGQKVGIEFHDTFEKFLKLMELNPSGVIFYDVDKVNERFHLIGDEQLGYRYDEDELDSKILKRIKSDIKKHNQLVKKHMGELQGYTLFTHFNGSVVYLEEVEIKFRSCDYELTVLLQKYEAEIQEYQERLEDEELEEELRQEREIEEQELRRQKEREEQMERILSEDKIMSAITTKESRVVYAQKIAKQQGITMSRNDISALLDIITAKKKLELSQNK